MIYEQATFIYMDSRTSPSAVIWWLVQKDNDVEDAVRLLGSLAQLSAAANDAEVPELFRHLVPTPVPAGQLPFDALVGDQQIPNGSFRDGSHQTTGFPWADFVAGGSSDVSPVARLLIASINTLYPDDEQRAHLAYRFANVIEKSGQPNMAQEIQQHFDAPATDKEPADLSRQDGELPD